MSASCAWLDIRPVLSERSPASAGVLVHRLPDTSLAARLRARARPLCRLDVPLADKRAKWRIDQPCKFLSSFIRNRYTGLQILTTLTTLLLCCSVPLHAPNARYADTC